MNNKEKREYINCLHLSENMNTCTPDEMVKINSVLNKCPKSFFKYRKFDKWTFDMIKNKYAYLSPVRNLDDPFDCISDFDTNEVVNIASKTVREKFFDHIIKETKLPISEKDIAIAKEYKDCFKQGDGFEAEKIQKVLTDYGYEENQASMFVNMFQNLINLSDAYSDDGTFDKFGKMYLNPADSFGVCSLSEIKNNKVMWSLYGKEYSGYCIEYCIKPNYKSKRFLFPVIYSRKANNNFSEKLFDSLYGEVNRHYFQRFDHGLKGIGSVGAIYEPLCSKDIDWSYQKEWRIVGGPKDHFTDLDIKAVYLGFKVAKSNEDKMLRYAKKYGFDLYKMKGPNGKKIIRFMNMFKVKC